MTSRYEYNNVNQELIDKIENTFMPFTVDSYNRKIDLLSLTSFLQVNQEDIDKFELICKENHTVVRCQGEKIKEKTFVLDWVTGK